MTLPLSILTPRAGQLKQCPAGSQLTANWLTREFFGWEAQDDLGYENWEDILSRFALGDCENPYRGLILDERLPLEQEFRQTLLSFSPGYIWDPRTL